jgi:hypothetical protein
MLPGTSLLYVVSATKSPHFCRVCLSRRTNSNVPKTPTLVFVKHRPQLQYRQYLVVIARPIQLHIKDGGYLLPCCLVPESVSVVLSYL